MKHDSKFQRGRFAGPIILNAALELGGLKGKGSFTVKEICDKVEPGLSPSPKDNRRRTVEDRIRRDLPLIKDKTGTELIKRDENPTKDLNSHLGRPSVKFSIDDKLRINGELYNEYHLENSVTRLDSCEAILSKIPWSQLIKNMTVKRLKKHTSDEDLTRDFRNAHGVSVFFDSVVTGKKLVRPWTKEEQTKFANELMDVLGIRPGAGNVVFMDAPMVMPEVQKLLDRIQMANIELAKIFRRTIKDNNAGYTIVLSFDNKWLGMDDNGNLTIKGNPSPFLALSPEP
jgi:hypothetical protein